MNKNEFKKIYKILEEESLFLSFVHTNSPSYQALLKEGESILPILLEEIEVKSSWNLIMLITTITNLEIPKKSRGKFKELTKICLDFKNSL